VHVDGTLQQLKVWPVHTITLPASLFLAL